MMHVTDGRPCGRSKWGAQSKWGALVLLSAVLGGAFSSAWAHEAAPQGASAVTSYDIRAQELAPALQELAHQAGMQLLFSQADVAGMKTHGIFGRFTCGQALKRLLEGSGLVYEFPSASSVIIRRPAQAEMGSGAARLLKTLVAAVSSPLTDSGAGDTGPSAGERSTEEVVVTGRAGMQQRTKEETSYSITTIDNKTLRLQGPTSVTESLKSVPGFWVESSGGEASGNVRARGVPVDGFGSITLLEDGMPVTHDPALGYLNGDQAFRLDETIDHIEVVRGGPSSIFYSNAPAGAVNFISRKVGETPEGVFKYTAGDYGLNRLDFWYGAPIGDWKASFGGFYRYDDGVRDPGFHGDNGGQLRFTLSRDFEKGKITFDVKRLDDIVFFDLDIPMQQLPNGTITGVPGFNANYGTVAGPETAFVEMKTPNGNFLFDNTDGTHVKRTQITLSLEFEPADGYRITDQVRYNDTDTLRNGVYANSVQTASSFLSQENSLLANYPSASALQLRYVDNGSVFNTLNQNGNGLLIAGGLRSVTSPVQELMNDLKLMHEGELFGTHDLTLGFYVADISQRFSRYSSSALLDVENNARLLDLVAVGPTGNVVGTLTDHGIYQYGYEWANSNGQSTTTAFYLSDEWQATRKLRIDAGARWEQVHLTANTEVEHPVDLSASLGTPAANHILTGTGQIDHFDETFSKVGWTIGANYQLTDRQGVFARYTPTFRLPNLSTYTGATLTSPTQTVALPITQTMDLGELGYKYANSWTDVYATAFWTKYNNVGFTNYVFNLNTPPIPQSLYADTDTYGLELEGGFYPVNWFDLTYSSTLEQPRYVGLTYVDNVANEPVLRNFDGNQLIRVPKVSVRIVPGFNLFQQRLRVQASWEWEGARYTDTANSMVLPHYDVLNLSASFAITPRLSLLGYLDNVTNSIGLTEGNPRAGELLSAQAGANFFIARPVLGRAFRAAIMYQL